MATKATRFIPEGFSTLTPYLVMSGASEAIEFYKKVFSATELVRMPMPNGKVGHAELRIGNSRFMLADEMPEMNMRGPKSLGGSPVGLCVYFEDCDAVFNRAVSSGAKVERPLVDDRHPQGRRVARGDQTAHGEDAQALMRRVHCHRSAAAHLG